MISTHARLAFEWICFPLSLVAGCDPKFWRALSFHAALPIDQKRSWEYGFWALRGENSKSTLLFTFSYLNNSLVCVTSEIIFVWWWTCESVFCCTWSLFCTLRMCYNGVINRLFFSFFFLLSNWPLILINIIDLNQYNYQLIYHIYSSWRTKEDGGINMSAATIFLGGWRHSSS